MITKKIHIESISEPEFVKEKQVNYSYAFRLLYKMFDESTNRDFIERFMKRFSLTYFEYTSLCSDVKSFRKREIKQKENSLKRIENTQEELEKDSLSKKLRFKKHNTIVYLTKRLEHESAFGGLELQRKLTRECNKSIRNEEKTEDLRQEFHDNRTLPFMIVGEANYKGNRYFDLSRINENIIIYKPYRGKKIELKVKLSNGYKKELLKVAEMAKSKELPVTASLKTDTIYITYDEERLNGYSVDEVSRRKAVKEIKEQKHPKEIENALIKEAYREYFRQQEEKKLQGKISERAIAIDMNPTNLGFSILDKTEDGVKVIYCGQFDLSKICKKIEKSSVSKESKYLTNKRHYEISIVVKELFKFAIHFKCSEFIIENLNFTEEGNESLNTESRRKTLNVWCRNKFEEYITRRCNETGISLVKINACYTSFIGNIKYSYVDATNASIEIGRRGLYKYKKGMFYPHMTVEDIHTLEAKFGDVVDCSTDGNWVNTYKSLGNQFNGAEFSHRLRAGLSEVKVPYETFSINSCRSDVYLTIFH